MTYNTKYRIPCHSKKGVQYELRLKKLDYSSSGPITDIEGRDHAIKIEDSNAKGGKLTPIRGTNMKMSLVLDPSDTHSGFKSDFDNILDKDWVAELIKGVGAAGYIGRCDIDTLSLTANSVPAEGTIEITHIGGLEEAPTCLVQFSILIFPDEESPPETMNFYAVPADETNEWHERKLVGTVDVFFDDTQDDVFVRLAAADPNFTYIDENVILYTQNTFDRDIDSGWNVKIHYFERLPKAYWFNNYNRFTGATQRQTLQLLWYTQKPSGDPEVTELATHYYVDTPLETLSSIVLDLVNQINGSLGYTQLNNVFFPITGNTKMMRITATANGATLELELLEILAVEGNSIVIQDTADNDTFLRVTKSNNGEYTWTNVNFTGGLDGGDTFTVEINTGGPWFTLAESIGNDYDTKETIALRLVNIIDAKVNFGAFIDPVDSGAFFFTTEPTYAAQYRFVTSGASTINDDGPGFDSSTLDTIIWVGWVLPDLYKQPHLPGYLVISLVAVCGLADLRNVDFPIESQYKYTKITLMQLLADILGKTDLALPIYEAFHLWEQTMDGDLSPLVQTYVDTSQIVGEDAFTVLEEVVALLQATLTQNLGRWELIPIKQQEETSYDYRVFDFLGQYLEDYTRTDIRVETGGETRDNIFLDRGTILQYDTPYNKVIFTQKYGYTNQQIAFPTFDEINGNLVEGSFIYPWKWMLDGVNQNSFLGKIHKNSDGYLVIQDATGQDDSLYLVQFLTIADLPRNTDQRQYELRVHLQGQQGNDDAATNFQIKVIRDDGVTPYYLEDDPVAPWTLIDTIISLDVKEFENDLIWRMPFSYISSSDPEVPLEIRIIQPSAGEGYIGIKFIELIINSDIVMESIMESHAEDIFDFRNTITAKSILQPKVLGDVPNVPGAMTMYKNALYQIDEDFIVTLTQTWVTDPDTVFVGIPILSSLRLFTLLQYVIPPIRLQASIEGALTLRSIIQDKTDNDYLFMLVTGSWDVLYDKVSGVYVQIKLSDRSLYPSTSISTIKKSVKVIKPFTTISTGTSGSKVPIHDKRIAAKTFRGTFLGSDLGDGFDVTITHDLEEELIAVVLFKNGQFLEYEYYTYFVDIALKTLTFWEIGDNSQNEDEYTYRLF